MTEVGIVLHHVRCIRLCSGHLLDLISRSEVSELAMTSFFWRITLQRDTFNTALWVSYIFRRISKSLTFFKTTMGNFCFPVKNLLVYPGVVLPYMGYIGMCRCEGYGFQAVYSSIRYINQSVWV